MIATNFYTHCGAWEFLLRLSQNDPAKATGRIDMDTASKVKSAGDVSTWHAMTADAVMKRLNTDTKKGLNAGEVASRLRTLYLFLFDRADIHFGRLGKSSTSKASVSRAIIRCSTDLSTGEY
jgi:hypothetical protein